MALAAQKVEIGVFSRPKQLVEMEHPGARVIVVIVDVQAVVVEVYRGQLAVEIRIVFAAFVQIAGAERADIWKRRVEDDGQIDVIRIVDESERPRACQRYRVRVFEDIPQMGGYEAIDKSYGIVHRRRRCRKCGRFVLALGQGAVRSYRSRPQGHRSFIRLGRSNFLKSLQYKRARTLQ